MSRRTSRQQSPLSREDYRVLGILETSKAQYERYQELREVVDISGPAEEPDIPVPNWHTPLTLVFPTSS